MSAGTVGLAVDSNVATITLDRPEKLNAITLEMLDRLEDAVDRVDRDPTVRAVVVRSAGEKVFCAGADIHRFRLLDGQAMWASWTRRGHQVLERLAELRQPTVAAVDGNAYGGGLELALACDLRVCAKGATLGLTEVSLGTLPGWGGTERLTRLIGESRAKQLVLTAEPVTAEQALAWGLVNWLTEPDQVLAAASARAVAIAERAPMAVQMAKQGVDVAAGARPGLALEGIASAATASHGDFAEGLAAFTERRPPLFQGLTTSAPEPRRDRDDDVE